MKPNIGARPNIGNRPNIASLPSTRPGGLGGDLRPGGSGPNLGLNRPGGMGQSPIQRPGGRPGGDPQISSLPNRPGTGIGGRPGAGTRPSPGDFLGLDQPISRRGTRPGIGDRPIAGVGPRPGFPGGDDRPGRPGNDLRPGRPGGDNRPPLAGGDNRPGRPGGDDRPGRPGGGDLVRPGAGGSGEHWRPGANDPTWRPGDNTRPWRPGDNNRPGLANRPGYGPGWNNNNIHNRPSWVNTGNINNTLINNQWNNAFLGTARPNWWNRAGSDQWSSWGNGVRDSWYNNNYGNNYFTNDWWGNHYDDLSGWHYGNQFSQYPSSYWWSAPQWGALSSWFTWNNAPPQNVWAQPVYYDYGPNGNVSYNNNTVYVGGQPIASAESYAMSAAELATVPAPASEQEAAAAEWMPLGTFAVSSTQQDVDPGRVLQLAVSKTGIVSGTLYNSTTDSAQSVLGQVDPQTQRVAFRIGENENVIIETGLGNLSQNEAAALVHFGPKQQETWLLVRLDKPGDTPVAANP